VLFPASGVTKGELIDYYERMAERMLPHLRERPLVLQRFPDGIEAEGFYQKQVGRGFPEWISRVRVELRTSRARQELVVCDSAEALAYLADQACIALHPWLSRRDRIDDPDLLVIDLDPPLGNFEAARRTALVVRALFDELELTCFPKLTGSRGVHVVAPLVRGPNFDTVRAFARQAMELLAARHPMALTTEVRRSERRGRLYLDTGRNAYGQTAVAPWSVRPLGDAPVAAPVRWRDLEHPGLGPHDYTVRNVFRRMARRSDPWGDLAKHACALEPARTRLEKLIGASR
jgi:bifunctional non-homologous end joining protein LigD